MVTAAIMGVMIVDDSILVNELSIDHPLPLDRSYYTDYTGTDNDTILASATKGVVTLAVNISDAIFANIEADNKYSVLWDSPNPAPPNGVPSGFEYGTWNAWMAVAGYTPQQRHEALGFGIDGRTRDAIANQCRAWMAING